MNVRRGIPSARYMGIWGSVIDECLLLESQFLWWQTELRTPEDQGRFIGIVASVRPYCMHIAPGALDRIMEEDSAAPTGLE